MADIIHSTFNLTQPNTDVPSGVVLTQVAAVDLNSVAVGSKVYVFRIPKKARIIDVTVGAVSVTAGTIEVGDTTTDTMFIASISSTNNDSIVRMSSASAVGYRYDAEDALILRVVTAAATASLQIVLTYSIT